MVEVEFSGSESKKRSTGTLAFSPALAGKFTSLELVVNVPKPYDQKRSTASDDRFVAKGVTASFDSRQEMCHVVSSGELELSMP
jgi:hypothetical protein